jgi:hypothetical protein
LAEKTHDKGYKYILSKRKHFLNMLKNFAQASWVANINEDDLELIEKEFILKNFKRKEADIIYKITLNGMDIIFYCLILNIS